MYFMVCLLAFKSVQIHKFKVIDINTLIIGVIVFLIKTKEQANLGSGSKITGLRFEIHIYFFPNPIRAINNCHRSLIDKSIIGIYTNLKRDITLNIQLYI